MIFSIQYMRAIAAVLVVINHAAWKGEQFSTNPLGWFNIGGVGVDLFFIISGYIMCHTVYLKKINFISFLNARIKRIIPLYWVLTTMALTIFIALPEKVNSSGGVINIIHSYTLFPVPIEDKYLIQNGWTLSYEFFFYFLFAFCLGLITKYKFILPATIIIILVSSGHFITSDNYLLGFVTNPLLLEFSFGIMAFYIFKTKQLSFTLGFFLIVLSILSITFVNIYDPPFSRIINWGFPAVLFFTGMMTFEPFFNRKKGYKISILFKMIGDSSYSLYLFHPFSLVVCSLLFSKIGLHNFGYMFVFSLVVSSIISGYLCYFLLEKNLLRIIKTNKKS